MLKFKKIVFPIGLLLFISVYSSNIFSQTHQIEEEYHIKAKAFYKKNSDSLLYYSKKMQESKNLVRQIFGFSYEANELYNTGKVKDAENLLNKTLAYVSVNEQVLEDEFINSVLFVGKNYNECIAIAKQNLYRRLFYIYKSRSEFTNAYNCLNERLKLVNTLTKNEYYHRQQIDITKNSVLIKQYLNDYKVALDIINELIHQLDNVKIKTNNIWYKDLIQEKLYLKVAKQNITLRLSFKNKRYIDSAITASNITEKFIKNNSVLNKMNLVSVYRYRAEAYLEQNQLDKVKNHIGKLDSLKQNTNYIKALYYNKIKENDSAIKHCYKFIEYNKKRPPSYLFQVKINEILSSSYNDLKNIDSAYHYSQKYIDIYNKGTDLQKEALNYYSNLELEKINKINIDISQSKTRTQYTLYISYFVFTIGLGVLMLYLYKRRKLFNKKYSELENKFEGLSTSGNNDSFEVKEELASDILKGLNKIENSTLFLDDNFNLNMLARLLNTNTSYLSSVINTYKGLSFKKYISELKLRYLINQIENNPEYKKYTLEYLGNIIGYKNASSFSRAFKSYKGVSPSEFINNL